MIPEIPRFTTFQALKFTHSIPRRPEKLTGFAETNYHDTRKKLRVEGRQLKSLINGKSYGIGTLELVSLRVLRERVRSGGGLPGRLKLNVVQGDVRRMHQLPVNAGALFQVASQFNLLEMVSPEAGSTKRRLCDAHRSSPELTGWLRRGLPSQRLC
jgi:hypothetical protein